MYTSLDFPGAKKRGPPLPRETTLWGLIRTTVVCTTGFCTTVRVTSDHFPGASKTTIAAISDNNIVGRYCVGNATAYSGFLYDGSTWTTLDYPGATSTWAVGVSGTNVIGTYQNGFLRHGFLYDGSSYITLNPPGSVWLTAAAISGNQIVGDYEDSGGQCASLYNGSTYTTVDYPGEFLQVYVYIWGQYRRNREETDALSSPSHVFLYNGLYYGHYRSWPWMILPRLCCVGQQHRGKVCGS